MDSEDGVLDGLDGGVAPERSSSSSAPRRGLMAPPGAASPPATAARARREEGGPFRIAENLKGRSQEHDYAVFLEVAKFLWFCCESIKEDGENVYILMPEFMKLCLAVIKVADEGYQEEKAHKLANDTYASVVPQYLLVTQKMDFLMFNEALFSIASHYNPEECAEEKALWLTKIGNRITFLPESEGSRPRELVVNPFEEMELWSTKHRKMRMSEYGNSQDIAAMCDPDEAAKAVLGFSVLGTESVRTDPDFRRKVEKPIFGPEPGFDEPPPEVAVVQDEEPEEQEEQPETEEELAEIPEPLPLPASPTASEAEAIAEVLMEIAEDQSGQLVQDDEEISEMIVDHNDFVRQHTEIKVEVERTHEDSEDDRSDLIAGDRPRGATQKKKPQRWNKGLGKRRPLIKPPRRDLERGNVWVCPFTRRMLRKTTSPSPSHPPVEEEPIDVPHHKLLTGDWLRNPSLSHVAAVRKASALTGWELESSGDLTMSLGAPRADGRLASGHSLQSIHSKSSGTLQKSRPQSQGDGRQSSRSPTPNPGASMGAETADPLLVIEGHTRPRSHGHWIPKKGGSHELAKQLSEQSSGDWIKRALSEKMVQVQSEESQERGASFYRSTHWGQKDLLRPCRIIFRSNELFLAHAPAIPAPHEVPQPSLSFTSQGSNWLYHNFSRSSSRKGFSRDGGSAEHVANDIFQERSQLLDEQISIYMSNCRLERSNSRTDSRTGSGAVAPLPAPRGRSPIPSQSAVGRRRAVGTPLHGGHEQGRRVNSAPVHYQRPNPQKALRSPIPGPW